MSSPSSTAVDTGCRTTGGSCAEGVFGTVVAAVVEPLDEFEGRRAGPASLMPRMAILLIIKKHLCVARVSNTANRFVKILALSSERSHCGPDEAGQYRGPCVKVYQRTLSPGAIIINAAPLVDVRSPDLAHFAIKQVSSIRIDRC
jgi:hypothetical protein